MRALPKRMLYPLVVIVLGGMLSGCGGGPSLTVNSNNDVDDGTCDSTHCSLREAINKANTLTGTVTIKFDIGSGGVQTIQPVSALPHITVPVHLDGTTQPGYGSAPLVELDGSLAGGIFVDGLVLQGGKSTVQALVINRFSGNGIRLDAPGENRVVGCYIGTDATGTLARANGVEGLYVSGEKNVIGGTGAGERNVISGNKKDGVWIDGIKASVIGNYIGTDVTGSTALANVQAGVVDDAGLAIIGGGIGGEGNVISGNGQSGVLLQADDSFVLGNRIGTDATGKMALGNQWGVSVSGTHNTVGGDKAGKRNIISANQREGVTLDPVSQENFIQGNYIGTEIGGTSGLGNGSHGVYIAGDNNFIGGDFNLAGNVISANLGDGVMINGMHNDVQGNLIGTDVFGTAALGNHGRGVSILHDLNLVGGEDAGLGNVIADNWEDGVRIEDGAVLVKGNFIGTNAAGTAALGNHKNGIYVSGAGSIQIGGGDPGAMNVISANRLNGIWLEATSNDVSIYGNRIGTDKAGTAALGNSKSGIYAGGTDIEIGASFAGARNLISGNVGAGIFIADKADGIVVKNNFIGTDAGGTAALGNDLGIEVDQGTGAASIKIGGAVIAPDEGNLISGNHKEGLLLNSGAKVWGNKIGTDASGAGALGNGGNGIWIKGSNNQIGGVNSGNTIAFNGKHGVAVISGSGAALQNAIQVNRIHDNAMLGIAIDEDFVIPNDSKDVDTGDNDRQNYPSLMAAFADTAAGTTTFVGKLTSKPNTTYSVEFFSNAACDPSGYGEGQSMFYKVDLTTDAQGYAVINEMVMSTSFLAGNFFTLTATDPAGNTSGFSNCVPMQEVVKGAATDTPGAMTFKPFFDPAEIFYGPRCTPDKVRLSVEIGNPPEPISYVLLFVRLMDQKTGEKTAWGGGLSMIAAGKNVFYYDLMAYDVPEYTAFESAWLQYQFVVYNKAEEKIGYSEVFGDVAFTRCGANKPPGTN